MKEIILSPELTKEIAAIYQAMQEGYDQVSGEVGMTCEDCPDNCCDSYFLHHTYSEWAYLWQGLQQLDPDELEQIVRRAKEYIAQSAQALAEGERPQIMCPLNDSGLCGLYNHRMLICRMHGIPATLTRPDGQSMRFPGCFRCQEIVKEKYEPETDAPAMDRSQLFRRLAALESRLIGERRHLYPRVKKTIAEMIVAGPPAVPLPHCER
ncbi:YkgJ family cysteine cluster protein [Candidatus Electrothrix laxa]